MALEEWIPLGGEQPAGGQGYVSRVKNRTDGRIGALKRQHQSKATERRYRFLTEVNALRAMDGNGVPKVLEANDADWENPDAELYLVMEFIDGPTLSESVSKSLPTLDQALASTVRMLEILGAGHRLPVHHRDLKPDNVILRAGRWDDPVLVDLGIAWFGGEEDVGFQTPAGSELGNRFLRLPEFAPGGQHRDARSDLAMAAGLLFFMLTGRAPRVPVDEDGRHPHEWQPSPVPASILNDKRWLGLSGILHVAFQQRLDARFATAEEFANRLLQLGSPKAMPVDDLDAELSRLKALNTTALAREREEVGPAMAAANRKLYDELQKIWTNAGLEQGGQNPVFKEGGGTNEFYCVVSRQGQTDPNVIFRHRIEVRDARLIVSWSIDNGTPHFEFSCSSAEGGRLVEETLAVARKHAGSVIRALNDKLTPPAKLDAFLK